MIYFIIKYYIQPWRYVLALEGQGYVHLRQQGHHLPGVLASCKHSSDRFHSVQSRFPYPLCSFPLRGHGDESLGLRRSGAGEGVGHHRPDRTIFHPKLWNDAAPGGENGTPCAHGGGGNIQGRGLLHGFDF